MLPLQGVLGPHRMALGLQVPLLWIQLFYRTPFHQTSQLLPVFSVGVVNGPFLP